MIRKRIKIKIKRLLFTTIVSFTLMSGGMVFADEALHGVIIRDNVETRFYAREDGIVTGTLAKNTIIPVEDVYGDWVLVNSGTFSGWVQKKDIFVKDINDKLLSYGNITASVLNVRKGPGLDFELAGKLDRLEKVFIIRTDGEWYYIKNNIVEGWVFSPYIEVSDQIKEGRVEKADGDIVISRGDVDRNKVAAAVKESKNVEILDFADGQYNVKYTDGTTEWLDKVDILSPPQIQSLAKEKDVVSIAKSYLGKPYRWGANGPNSFDCSGYTKYVFNKLGVDLPRVSRDQAKLGQAVSRDQLQVGDLVFFDTSGKMNNYITNVGIYIGNNEFIHASSSNSGKYVRISSMIDDFYNSRFVTARRVR